MSSSYGSLLALRGPSTAGPNQIPALAPLGMQQPGWLATLSPPTQGYPPSALYTLNLPNHKRILLPPSCSGTALILLVVITIDANIPHNSNSTNTTTGVPSTVCCVLTGFQQKAPASRVLILPLTPDPSPCLPGPLIFSKTRSTRAYSLIFV